MQQLIHDFPSTTDQWKELASTFRFGMRTTSRVSSATPELTTQLLLSQGRSQKSGQIAPKQRRRRTPAEERTHIREDSGGIGGFRTGAQVGCLFLPQAGIPRTSESSVLPSALPGHLSEGGWQRSPSSSWCLADQLTRDRRGLLWCRRKRRGCEGPLHSVVLVHEGIRGHA